MRFQKLIKDLKVYIVKPYHFYLKPWCVQNVGHVCPRIDINVAYAFVDCFRLLTIQLDIPMAYILSGILMTGNKN